MVALALGVAPLLAAVSSSAVVIDISRKTHNATAIHNAVTVLYCTHFENQRQTAMERTLTLGCGQRYKSS
jgi:hypothetical protein